MQKACLKTENFEGKEVLSDVGTAIKAFCQMDNMEKNYCHYHIINAFEARSCFSIWTSRLLKWKTYPSYLHAKVFVISELNEYIEKLKTIDTIDEKFLDSKDNPFKFKSQILKSSNYFIKWWANWIRREKHIPRCSNHSEMSLNKMNISEVLLLKVGLSTIFRMWNIYFPQIRVRRKPLQ